MSVLPFFTAAIAPGVALLSYFYLKDRYDPEPISLVLRMFLFGVLIVFPIMVLQNALLEALGQQPFVFSFVITAAVEEFFKWFLLYFLIFKHTSFDEPYDGIVYAVAVSLGFATLENVFYVLEYQMDFAGLMYRAFLPVSGHAMFGVIMGYHLGKAKFSGPSVMRRQLIYSFTLPLLWHGTFDYILLVSANHWVWFMVPLMLFLWMQSLLKVSRANSKSSLRVMTREEQVKI